jgi:hypothetical protein
MRMDKFICQASSADRCTGSLVDTQVAFLLLPPIEVASKAQQWTYVGYAEYGRKAKFESRN